MFGLWTACLNIYNKIHLLIKIENKKNSSRNENELWNVKNTLMRSHHWLPANLGASLCKLQKPPVSFKEGPKHNRCCLISKIIERLGWIPWQCSPYVLLVLEECQGRIRSAEVHCALWNSTLKTASGERGGLEVGGLGWHTGRNFWSSKTSFFFFLLLLYHGNMSRNVTPLSPETAA